jgi:hypothetical protein
MEAASTTETTHRSDPCRMGYYHTPEDQLEAVEEELQQLYRRQRQAETAREEGRVANYAEWRESIARRAERIRELGRQRDMLIAQRDAWEDHDDQGGPSCSS